MYKSVNPKESLFETILHLNLKNRFNSILDIHILLLKKSDPQYCKRGYFRWGKISQKKKPFTQGLFSRYYSYFLNKVTWVNFSRGGNFCDEGDIAKKPRKLPQAKFSTFTVYQNIKWTTSIIVIL